MIEIHSAQKKDVPDIVDIHLQSFPDFFLTQLGKDFLNLYYCSVLEHPQGILLVSTNETGEAIGFCAGTVVSSGFNGRIVKDNFISYSLEGLKLLFTKPLRLLRLLKNMSKENSKVGDKGEYAELMSIGVNPNTQRTGAGKAMLLAFEDEVRKYGSRDVSLTTDYYENEKAIGFYHSMGYKEWYDFVTYPDRRMYRMIKNL